MSAVKIQSDAVKTTRTASGRHKKKVAAPVSRFIIFYLGEIIFVGELFSFCFQIGSWSYFISKIKNATAMSKVAGKPDPMPRGVIERPNIIPPMQASFVHILP